MIDQAACTVPALAPWLTSYGSELVRFLVSLGGASFRASDAETRAAEASCRPLANGLRVGKSILRDVKII